MKIETKQENALIVGAETTQFGLNVKDPSIFVQMLLNLYSDPIGSVVRETASNALDANKESGTDKPVIIGIENNKFFVQDFGKGLSPEFMNSNEQGYCTIGYSTKRDSDVLIGGYGMGRCASLSYTNQYWVNTVHKGIAYEYLIFLDGNTIKQTLLKKEETSEPSGTRVVVQINKNWKEADKWIDAIKKQCQYFENTVVSINGNVQKVEVTKDILWSSSLSSSNLHFILGCVYYEIDWNQFKKWNTLFYTKGGIHISLDQGVYPTPNRESLVLDNNTVTIIDSIFEQLATKICNQCEQAIEFFKNQSDIVKLRFLNDGIISTSSGIYEIKLYKDLCQILKLPVNSIDFDFYKSGALIFRKIRDSFQISGYGETIYYCEKWTPLKLQYLKTLPNHSIAKKATGNFDLMYLVNVNVPVDVQDRLLYQKQETEKVKERLFKEYIDEFFTPFPEEKFQEWKQNRVVSKKKQSKKGIIYYRTHHFNKNLCVEQKGEIDLNKYPCLFKATKETAQKYWHLLNVIYKNKLMITKTEGYDLDKLEPSPFLRRMCTEALKYRVYEIIGKQLLNQETLDFIKELNPLLYQWIIDIDFKCQHEFTSADEKILKALIETGELLGFGHEEVKLKYIEHHLNKLKLLKKIGTPSGYPTYHLRYSDEDKQIIKRFYTLERLVEKKQIEFEPTDKNQLELELV